MSSTPSPGLNLLSELHDTPLARSNLSIQQTANSHRLYHIECCRHIPACNCRTKSWAYNSIPTTLSDIEGSECCNHPFLPLLSRSAVHEFDLVVVKDGCSKSTHGRGVSGRGKRNRQEKPQLRPDIYSCFSHASITSNDHRTNSDDDPVEQQPRRTHQLSAAVLRCAWFWCRFYESKVRINGCGWTTVSGADNNKGSS